MYKMSLQITEFDQNEKSRATTRALQKKKKKKENGAL